MRFASEVHHETHVDVTKRIVKPIEAILKTAAVFCRDDTARSERIAHINPEWAEFPELHAAAELNEVIRILREMKVVVLANSEYVRLGAPEPSTTKYLGISFESEGVASRPIDLIPFVQSGTIGFMRKHAIIWDLQTIADLTSIRAAREFTGTDEELEAKVLKGQFPKPVFHQIVCSGAIIAEHCDTGWQILRRSAPHCGTRNEADLIQVFVDRIEDLPPVLVTFNGHFFGLPVLRHRAMIHRIRAPGLMPAPARQETCIKSNQLAAAKSQRGLTAGRGQRKASQSGQ